MVLAVLEREHPDELRADFQQYYNLNYDGVGGEYTYLHAAALATQLPSDSRTFTAVDPDNAWNLEARLLSHIEFRLRAIEWELAGSKGAEPKPIFNPRKSGRASNAMSIDDLREYLSRRRTADGS